MPKQNTKINQLLDKAKDSALLAISIYNDPKTSFRTSGFLVMICIAWTSLLHANFEKKKIKYFYIDKKNSTLKRKRYFKIEGDFKAWELPTCIKKEFGVDNAIYKNLEFLYQLRNKIEHRFLPEIDSEVLGECQACVLNFEKFLVEKFGTNHSIIGNFSVPLQLTLGFRELPKLKADKIIDFINSYRNSLSDNLENNHKFSAKFYFFPKIGDHKTSSDYALEFISTDNLPEEKISNLKNYIVAIKEMERKGEPIKYLPSVLPPTDVYN